MRRFSRRSAIAAIALITATAEAQQTNPPATAKSAAASSTAPAAAPAARPEPGDPALRRLFLDLVAENSDAARRYSQEIAKIRDPKQREAFMAERWPTEKFVVGRMIDLARRHPDDPSAFDALAWLVIFGYNTDQSDEAAGILARRYADDRRLWLIAQEMRRGVDSPARATILRAILDRGPDRATRGRACLELADYHVDLAEFVRILATPGMLPWQAVAYLPARLDRFRALDPSRLETEAERLYRRVLDEFADVTPIRWWTSPRMTGSDPRTIYSTRRDPEVDTGTLADTARPALVELTTLGVGRVAPDIQGVDVDGHPLRLSDHRGRVVVLTFSGTWCGPCKAMYPHQREIVQRLKGKPFALLSIMTDENADAIRKEIASGDITWPCWWERGGTQGAIPTAWNVRGYPTVYILDHKGVIRLKSSGLLATSSGSDSPQPPIDEFLDTLLREQAPR